MRRRVRGVSGTPRAASWFRCGWRTRAVSIQRAARTRLIVGWLSPDHPPPSGSGPSMPPTLASSRDIRAVYAARSGVHGPGMSVHARPRADREPGRAAVVAGRGVGGAVRRNRAKRRLRAVLRAEGLPNGFDLVVVAKSGAVVAPYPLLLREYARLQARAVERAGMRA